MRPLCLSRGEEDKTRAIGGQRLSLVAMRMCLHKWRVRRGLTCFVFQNHVDLQFAVSLVLVVCFVAPTPSPLFVLVSFWVGKYLHWFYQCDGTWWLPLSGLTWIPARSARITRGSTISKAPSPSSSIGDGFNEKEIQLLILVNGSLIIGKFNRVF